MGKMLETLDNAASTGVKITVVTRPAEDYADKDRLRSTELLDLLKKHRITVIERANIHQKFAVVDGRTSWYGSINLLSFGNSEESIMRLESKGISEELMRIVL